MEEMNAAVMAGTTKTVQIWMNWMMSIFLASIIFCYKHVSARYILGVFFLTLPIAIFIFDQTKNIHLLGISHIIGWLPLSIYLILTEIKGKKGFFKKPYGIYLILLLATIGTSFIFDIRDIYLVMMGVK
ncbi:MAG: hypothetical protein MI865_03750 [Proteobacteria bacterium]|nr:hypothetical protein [Pseudomonadota bacterium]